MTLQERLNQRIFVNNMRYSIYRGREHDLYISLPDCAKLQRCFEIIFDKEGIDPPYILFRKKKYELVPPLLTEDKGYYCIHGKFAGTKGLHKIPLHRLAYISFYGTPPPGYHIHHIDRNKHNNAASNLVALTEEEHCSVHMRDVRVPRNLFTKSKPRGLIAALTSDARQQQERYEAVRGPLPEENLLTELESSLTQPKLLQLLTSDFTEERLSALVAAVLNCRNGSSRTVIEILCERYNDMYSTR